MVMPAVWVVKLDFPGQSGYLQADGRCGPESYMMPKVIAELAAKGYNAEYNSCLMPGVERVVAVAIQRF